MPPIAPKRAVEALPFYTGARTALEANSVIQTTGGSRVFRQAETVSNAYPFVVMTIPSLTTARNTYGGTIADCLMDVQAVDQTSSDDADLLAAAINAVLLDAPWPIPGYTPLDVVFVLALDRASLSNDVMTFMAGSRLRVIAEKQQP